MTAAVGNYSSLVVFHHGNISRAQWLSRQPSGEWWPRVSQPRHVQYFLRPSC